VFWQGKAHEPPLLHVYHFLVQLFISGAHGLIVKSIPPVQLCKRKMFVGKDYQRSLEI